MMPAFAKPRRKVVVKRTETLKEWVETCPFNRVEKGDTSIGIICAGAVYEHVKEALGDVSIFKLGVTWPLPADALARFAESVDKVYVVEEASTYLSDAVRSCGIALGEFVNPLPADGEVHPEDILHAFGRNSWRTSILLPMFPIVRLLFVRAALIVSSSVSWRAIRLSSRAISVCAIRSAPCRRSQLWIPRSTWAPPFRWRLGLELAMAGSDHRPIVGVIGDSTFAHSGLSSLINTVYNKGAGTICILDNRTTAMTWPARQSVQWGDAAKPREQRAQSAGDP